MNDLMNFKFLLKTEIDTFNKSEKEILSWQQNYESILNTFFQFIYFVGDEKDPKSIDGMFLTFTHTHYLKIPYTIRATTLLLETGYYAESALLVRNLFEVLVQLRYFQLNKNLLNEYVLKTKKTSYRTMIAYFNDNLYTTVYHALSTISHAEFGSTIFRTNYKSPSEGKTIMGCEFNKMFYHFNMNILTAILYGLLNFIPAFFNQYLQNVPKNIEEQRKKCVIEVDKILNSEPKSIALLKDISALIGLNLEKK